MSLSPSGMTPGTFQIHFQPQDWKEGQILQQKGEVLSCRPLTSDRTVSGVVREVLEEFRVGLTVNPMQFRGSCTCWQKARPQGTCKHMVALLFHWLSPPPRAQVNPGALSLADERYLKQIGQTWQATGVLHEVNEVKLQVLARRNSQQVQRFLTDQGWARLWEVLQEKNREGRLQESPRSMVVPSPVPGGSASVTSGQTLERQLVFVLEPLKTEPVLTPPRLQPMLGAIKEGKLLHPQNFVPGRTSYLPLQEEGQFLRQVLEARGEQLLHPKSALGSLLERLLNCGLLYLSGHWDRPLRQGKDREGVAGWTLDQQGDQHPHVQVSPAADLLLLEDVWFLDPSRLEVGRVNIPHPSAQLDLFLRWPHIPPEKVVQAQGELQKLDPHLPPPAGVDIQQEWLLPQFQVVLEGRPATAASRFQSTPQLRFSVCYAELNVPGVCLPLPGQRGFRGSPLRKFEKGILRLFQRDQRLEQEAVNFLHENGCSAVEWSHGEVVFRCETGLGKEDPLRHILTQVLPEMKHKGWQVHLSPTFPAEVVAGPVQGQVHLEDGWFALELGVEVWGKTVPLLPLLLEWMQNHPQMLRSLLDHPEQGHLEHLPMGDGRFLQVELHRLTSVMRLLLEFYQEGSADPTLRVPRMAAGCLSDLTGQGDVTLTGEQDLLALTSALEKLREAPVGMLAPAALQADLRPYQSEGVAWLQRLREVGLGGVLADDMGLGKTLQTLTHLLIEKEQDRLDRPVLVVAPTSLMGNWLAEARKFTPSLRTLMLHGPGRHRRHQEIPEVDVVFTTYPLLVRDLGLLQQYSYHLIVLDEAQHIKNPRGQASQALLQLKSRHRLCLTGTPIENHLGELWSLFRFLNPGLLPAEGEFRQLFRDPIEKDLDPIRQERLSRMVGPFMLRRSKTQVVSELPSKTEVVVRLELAGEQRDAYEALRVATHDQLREEIEQRGLASSQIHVLSALLKLRQVCCHPPLARFEEARKVKASVKLEWFKRTLPEMLGRGQRILVFSQFTSLLSVLQEELEAQGVPYALLTGQTLDRAEQVRRFQNGEAKVFLISLKAGGVGLNLTAADTVIHFDPWWNPAAENQATDRAYRIGQDKPVFVYKLVTTGTIEEKILFLQERKAKLAHQVLHGGPEAGQQLTRDDVEMLLEQRV